MDEGNTPAFDVVVIGAIGVDTNVYLHSEDPVSALEMGFCPIRDCAGQAGSYACQSYARLGYRTGLIGALGQDANGTLLREQLGRQGIDLGGLFTDPEGTKRSVNLMRPSGSRKGFYDGRGAMHLEPDLDHCRAYLRGARVVHVNIVNWARHLLPIAREAGALVATDLQDLVEIDDEYRRDFVVGSDILFFSCVNHDDPAPIFDHLFAAGSARIAICGQGERGCTLATREGQRLHFPAIADGPPVVDTNGAGDCLAAGFLSAHVLDGFPFAKAIERGLRCARHVCTLKSDSENLMTLAMLGEPSPPTPTQR